MLKSMSHLPGCQNVLYLHDMKYVIVRKLVLLYELYRTKKICASTERYRCICSVGGHITEPHSSGDIASYTVHSVTIW